MFSLEGVGDEVIDFFLTLTLVFIAFIAWWTTNLSERPLMQTVFIVERRTVRRAQPDLQTIRDTPEPEEMIQESREVAPECKAPTQSNSKPDVKADPKSGSGNADTGTSSTSAEGPSTDVAPEPADAENVSDNESRVQDKRLALFEPRQENSGVLEVNESDDTDDANTTDENTTEDGSEAGKPDDGTIRIRLKYLNDDQKLVDGKLDEQLGDFKRRHFNVELSAQKLVRLIFKGKVLQEDSKTLENCGFFDNCVVHCLIQSRSPPPSPSMNRAQNEARAANDNGVNWDLGNILFAGLSVLLGVAWYGRFHYAQLYTATTTVTLVGLTGIFTVSLIGMYMPDTDGIRA